MYQDFSDDSRQPKPASRISNHRCCAGCIALIGIVASLSCLAVIFYMCIKNNEPELECPQKMVSFKVVSPDRGNQLWAYATFWSVCSGQRDRNMDQKAPKFAPARLLEDLQRTFQPLSVKPFEYLPEHCRSKIPQIAVETQGFPDFGNAMFEFPDSFIPFASPLFSADLKSEFRFKDNITDQVRLLMYDASLLGTPLRNNSDFDSLIPIYLSTITPELEQHLSLNGTTNVKKSQMDVIRAAMEDYRKVMNPLFVVVGNHSEGHELDGTDVVKVAGLPDNVALALISSSNATIFNHGLWPAFGALLGRSNVTSYAMNKTLLESANNASLNWKASVTY